MKIREVLERRALALTLLALSATMGAVWAAEYANARGVTWPPYLFLGVVFFLVYLSRHFTKCPRCYRSIGSAAAIVLPHLAVIVLPRLDAKCFRMYLVRFHKSKNRAC